MTSVGNATSTAPTVTLAGALGEAIEASYRQRLKKFVEDETSLPISLYSAEQKEANRRGDWYGEHAGKWLVAASRAAMRTGDQELANTVLQVARFLADQQEANGYLGTYASDATCRFTNPGAKDVRSWDVWNHSYMILGLLEANALLPSEGFLSTAVRIADLLIDTFNSDSLTSHGNHNGLSSTVLLDPIVSLYFVTKNQKYLTFANRIVDEIEKKPELRLIGRAIEGDDAAKLGTGKAYQLIWTFLGIAKLFQATGEPRLLEATLAFHANVWEHHLTLGGGPWGGIGGHAEVFNAKGFFSPQGFVETCSSMAWISLNRQLLELTGEGRFAEAIEVCVQNSILGAIDENGADWSYFIFPNGRRNSTYDWACCKSSGALALEEAALSAYTIDDGGLSINFFNPGRVTARTVKVSQSVIDSSTEQTIEIGIDPEVADELDIKIRIPSWAVDPILKVNGAECPTPIPGKYAPIQRVWESGDRVTLSYAIKLRTHCAAHVALHHGQEVVREDYVAATYGPYVLATGLIDGFKRQETLHAPQLFPETLYEKVAVDPPAFEMRPPGRKPILFVPYNQAGGRTDGKWRLTWMQVAWQ